MTLPRATQLVPVEPTMAMKVSYGEACNRLGLDQFANLNVIWPVLLESSPDVMALAAKDIPKLVRDWPTPWYVHPDGVKSSVNGGWVMNATNHALNFQIVDLANAYGALMAAPRAQTYELLRALEPFDAVWKGIEVYQAQKEGHEVSTDDSNDTFQMSADTLRRASVAYRAALSRDAQADAVANEKFPHVFRADFDAGQSACRMCGDDRDAPQHVSMAEEMHATFSTGNVSQGVVDAVEFHKARADKAEALVAAQQEILDQCRLAIAGKVSMKSAADMIDAGAVSIVARERRTS